MKPATCICENGKYVRSIIDDSAITCDKIREETKTVSTNSKEKKGLPMKEKISMFFYSFFC